MNRAKPFAVFDIDGTLIRWQLFHAVMNLLAQRGHLGANAYEQVLASRLSWKHRQHPNAFEHYEKKLVALYYEALRTIPVAEFDTAVKQAIEEYKDQVYVYTRTLQQDLKAKGYLLFAISGSPEEAVAQVARYYDFDDWMGTTLERSGGFFTGKTEVASRTKHVFLERLLAKHDVTSKGSIGVGDTASDITMLEAVEQPIAFNPNRTLFDHAKAKGWRIVVERKNVVCELEAKNGIYTLQ